MTNGNSELQKIVERLAKKKETEKAEAEKQKKEEAKKKKAEEVEEDEEEETEDEEDSDDEEETEDEEDSEDENDDEEEEEVKPVTIKKKIKKKLKQAVPSPAPIRQEVSDEEIQAIQQIELFQNNGRFRVALLNEIHQINLGIYTLNKLIAGLIETDK